MLLCGLHCFANYQECINGCYIAAAVNIANAEIKAAGNGRCNNPKGHAKHGEGVGRSYNTVAVNITEKAYSAVTVRFSVTLTRLPFQPVKI